MFSKLVSGYTLGIVNKIYIN